MPAFVTNIARIALIIAAGFAVIMAILPHPPTMPGEPTDKVQHIVAFVVLGGLARIGWPDRSPLALLIGLILFGAAIEAVQAIPALGRESSLADLSADALAALVALWLAGVLMLRRWRN